MKEIIVVVDDEPAARSAVVRLLQERGYTVYALAGGQEAIDFVSRNNFDVLLTDFRMPSGLDGLITIRAIRAINPQAVCILMTGYSSIDLAIQSLNSGVHGFVVKPFTAFELTRTIEQTIAQQTLIRENIKIRALVDVFATTQALITAEVEPSRLPRLTLELAMGAIAAERAFLLVNDESQTHFELNAVAQRIQDEKTGNEIVIALEASHLFQNEPDFEQKLRVLGEQAIVRKASLMLVDNEEIKDHKARMGDLFQMVVPLLAQGRNVGALIMERQSVFSEVDLQTAAILAGQAAIAIDNTNLFRRLARIEALHEADRLRSEFVATVSHELRTPLTSIKGYATTLLRPDVQWNNQTGHEYLTIISEECDKLMELINNILEVSKIEAGVLKIFPEPIHINEVLDRTVNEARRVAPYATIKVEYPPVEDMPLVWADPQRIIQVLRNLIQNALKYSPSEPYIKVKAQLQNSSIVQIAVQDNGLGLRPEDQAQIFERFFRVDTGAARRTEGTGLGLAICRGIVEAHGGLIWVESAGLGRGSTFNFTLPISEGFLIDLD